MLFLLQRRFGFRRLRRYEKNTYISGYSGKSNIIVTLFNQIAVIQE